MVTNSTRRIMSALWCMALLFALFSTACTGDDEPEGTGPADEIGSDVVTGDTIPTIADGCQVDSDCSTSFVSLGGCESAVCELGKCVIRPKQDGINCNPSDLCTVNAQCSNGSCLGTNKGCDDSNLCTDDTCDTASGDCLHIPNESVCDDGVFCTNDDRCKLGACAGTPDPLCQCDVDTDCLQFDDADLCNGVLGCTNHQCIPQPGSEVTCSQAGVGPCESLTCDSQDGVCKATPLPEGTVCDDGDACSKNDICWTGQCQGQPVVCDDSNLCTDDACDSTLGCTNTPNTVACDDGDLCTVDDSCTSGACTGGTTNPGCDCALDSDCASFEDGNLCNGTLVCLQGKCEVDTSTEIICDSSAVSQLKCTTVTCEPATGECVTKAELDGAECDDGNACTDQDYCYESNCVGLPVNCDDQKACTEDSCDPASGCVYGPKNGNSCGDYNACTYDDTCVEGECVGTTDPDCQCISDADCGGLEDLNLCNGTLHCVNNQCLVNEASIVDCGATLVDPCTTGVCNPDTGKCSEETLQDADLCDDGDACTQADVCISGACVGKAVGCDDGDLCTDDTCDTDIGCVHSYGDAPCDDGNACTDNDSCKEGLCAGTPLEGCVCDADVDCADFEDGNPCNGSLICQTNKCVVDPATIVACPAAGDSQCEVNQCDPTQGVCVLFPFANGKPCDDGDACTLDDACSGGGCLGDGTLFCDDENACTDDTCNPTVGCIHPATNGSCDDGDACTEGDFCEEGSCIPGATNACPGQCAPNWALACGESDHWNTGYPDAGKELETYGCTGWTYPGGEYIYTLVAPYDGTLTVTLSDEETVTDVLILEDGGDGCDVESCSVWGFAQAETEMVEGQTYYLVVDGYLDQEGSYTIEADCTPQTELSCEDGLDDDDDGLADCDDPDCFEEDICQPPQCNAFWNLSCGDSDTWTSYGVGSTQVFDGYDGCFNIWSYSAPEYAYVFTSPFDGLVTVNLRDESAETDVIVLADSGAGCVADACVAYGLGATSFEATAGQTYYLVVDGYLEAEGSFTIDVACEVTDPDEVNCDNELDDDDDGLADCEDPDCFFAPEGGVCQPACKPAGAWYAKMSCPDDSDSWNPQAKGSADVVTAYSCSPFDYTGPEYVYTYVADTDTEVSVTVTDDTNDLDLIILEDKGLGCNPASCLDWGLDTVTFTAEAGTTYYLVVDGWQGAIADYDLVFSCGQ